MFTSTTFQETSRLEDLFDAWVAAAHETQVAWETWSASAAPDRAAAYVCYCAGLDREEQAAAVLAGAVGRRRPLRLAA